MKENENQAVQTCIYCGADLYANAPSSQFDPQGGIPVQMSDEEWQKESTHHNTGCEWVTTRAHTTLV